VDGCECIFHLAGLASVQLSLEQPLLCHEVNATGTLRLLETSRQAGAARFIYAGSSSAYGNPQRPTCGEGERAQALSAYAAAKLAGELYVEAYARTFGMKTVRLRFFNVYGPRQQADSPYSGVISRFIRLLQQGERPTIYGDGLQTRDFVYVSDVVEALCLASRYARLEGQVYNVGSGRSTNLLELLDALAGIAARAIEPIFAATRSGDVRASRADIHLATSELGFAPKISLPAGLKLTWNSLAEGCGA
jgi:UDP-glucose 4-epimerase